MSDPSKPQPPSDPQQPTGSGTSDPSSQPGAQQQGQSQEDVELIGFLIDEHGHTEHSAKQELKNNREGVKHKHKLHKQRHG